MIDPGSIHKYFDDEMTPSELEELQQWLNAEPANMSRFVEIALVHDRLRGQFQAQSVLRSADGRPEPIEPIASQATALRWSRRKSMAIGGLAASLLVAIILWRGDLFGTAHAGQVELRRVIAASAQITHKTFSLQVESITVGGASQKRDTAAGQATAQSIA